MGRTRNRYTIKVTIPKVRCDGDAWEARAKREAVWMKLDELVPDVTVQIPNKKALQLVRKVLKAWLMKSLEGTVVIDDDWNEPDVAA